jgi:hypothetical protein
MMSIAARRTAAFIAALLALSLVAACGPSRMVQQQTNPEYAGKKFKRVLVVGVTSDDLARRVFEDDAVAKLRARGIDGVPGYSLMPKPGNVDEPTLRSLIAKSGADGVLITRVTAVDTEKFKTGGATVAMGYGFGGWGGFYDYYNTSWQTVYVPSQTVDSLKSTASETRLFDARNGNLVWMGVVTTLDRGGTLGAGLTQYTDVVFDAMTQAGVI